MRRGHRPSADRWHCLRASRQGRGLAAELLCSSIRPRQSATLLLLLAALLYPPFRSFFIGAPALRPFSYLGTLRKNIMASSEASHQSSNDHDAFAMSASMRPTLLTDPLDGRETSMTDGFRFIRRHIEFFPASVADVEDRRKKGGIKSEIRVGQIGIRCVHCSHIAPENRVNGTATFPTNLSLVYQSVRNWQSKSSR